MHPQLWTLPILGLPIYAYGFMVMLGFLAAIFVASQRAKKLGLNPEIILDLGIVTMIAGIIGARLCYIIIFWSQFTASWKMFNLFDGNLNIPGGIVGWFIPYAIFRLKRSPHQGRHLLVTFGGLFLASFISSLLVARIVYLMLHRAEYDFSLFQVWKGGLVFYGGIILAIPAGMYYLKKKGLKVGTIADLVAPPLALGVALGRIGCLLNGCCYGMLAHGHKLALRFPKILQPQTGDIIGSPAFRDHLAKQLITPESSWSLPVHPTQIYESVFCLVLFVVLSIIWTRRPRPGLLLGLLLLFYPAGRFIIEFFRGDKGPVLWGLTDSQIISLGLATFALIFIISTLRAVRKSADNGD